ncbi:hypothetical protein NPIL_373931 [Nephila pilipes]|uniref:Uncharacterized protein n=1 Tax=Nephila pilipes TaxID=299642 RepID=A0A8X6P2C4_NEPPI|nr:hypothetical protein NPIL_373931 [Nephila pilipes]
MADDKIKLVKAKRDTARTTSIKSCKNIENELIKEDIDVDDLQELIERLMIDNNEIKTIDEKFEEIVYLKDLEKELAGAVEYEEKRYRITSRLQENLIYENSTNEIHVLIGAGIAEKLYIRRFENLPSGFTLIESLMGWTVIDKTDKYSRKDNLFAVAEVTITAVSFSQKKLPHLEKTKDFGQVEIIPYVHLLKVPEDPDQRSTTEVPK